MRAAFVSVMDVPPVRLEVETYNVTDLFRTGFPLLVRTLASRVPSEQEEKIGCFESMTIVYRCWLPVPPLVPELSVAMRAVVDVERHDSNARVGMMLIFMFG